MWDGLIHIIGPASDGLALVSEGKSDGLQKMIVRFTLRLTAGL